MKEITRAYEEACKFLTGTQEQVEREEKLKEQEKHFIDELAKRDKEIEKWTDVIINIGLRMPNGADLVEEAIKEVEGKSKALSSP